MWRLTFSCNVFALFLFWLLSRLAITPAYNLLVQYAETNTALPMLTEVAISIRTWAVVVPSVWALLTFFLVRRIPNQTETRRNEIVLLHTSTSLCLGLLLLFVFALAGILPVLKIGAVLN